MNKKPLCHVLAIPLTIGLLLSLAGPYITLAQTPVDQSTQGDYPASIVPVMSQELDILPNSTENVVPVAVADTYEVESGTALTVDAASGVLANDVDADGDPLTAQLMSATAFGSLIFRSDGSFVYTPNPGYIGKDTFVYKAYDGLFYSTPVPVTFNVIEGANAQPVALADTYAVVTGTTLTVDAASGVLANDSDADGDPLVAQLVSGTAFGSLTFYPNGSFVYIPNAGYTGADHFIYEASDGEFTSNPVIVTINVTTGDNTPPVAVGDTYSVETGTILEMDAASGVLANDIDAEGDALTAQLVGAGTAQGILTFRSDGSFKYEPNVGYIGSDRFVYTASDGVFTSTSVTVTINVTSEDETVPVAVADTYSVETGATLTVDAASGVLSNDFDVDGDVLTAQLVGAGTSQGILTFNHDGSFVYVPKADFTGTDRFIYQASDGLFTSIAAVVTINVTSEGKTAPVAVADTYAVETGDVLTVDAPGVLANDIDADGDALTAQLVGGGTAQGLLTFNSDGSFKYTPIAGYIGSDSFVYQAYDGLFTSIAVKVTINVTVEGKTPPIAVADIYAVKFETTLTVDAASGVLANDLDADGDVLIAYLMSGTAFGSLSFHPDGSFVYVPRAGYIGADRFTYQAWDGWFASTPVMVTINVKTEGNTIPIAVADTYAMETGTTLTVDAAEGVLVNDSDADGDVILAQLVAGTTEGNLTLNPDGSFVYEPVAGYTGADHFVYQANDGLATSLPVMVTINVIEGLDLYLPVAIK
jgi:hypothetical protein